MKDKIKWSKFISFMELEKGGLDNIPTKSGVYSIWRSQKDKIEFIERGTGGRFKDKDPNVPVNTLQEKLVDDAKILYLGKSNNLRERIKQLRDFGRGKRVGHRGGRYIWQIKNATGILKLRWKVSGKPRKLEKKLLFDFEKEYGRLPFANLGH